MPSSTPGGLPYPIMSDPVASWPDTFEDMANELGADWVPWTPTWRNGSGGAALSVGSGTFEGASRLCGIDTAEFYFHMIRAADTALGTLDWAFTLPYTALNVWSTLLHAYVIDVSAGSAGGIPHLGVAINTTELMIHATSGRRIDNGGFGTTPTAWATSDELRVQGRYRIAP